MGKSGSGKDTVFKELMRREDLTPVVPYTTRPARANERDGHDYFFIDAKRLCELESNGKVIESRCYNTVHGEWFYATVDDGRIDLSQGDYILITTPAAYVKISAYFGADNVVPVYIQVDDGFRLTRAISREREQEQPNYEEICRRFLADCDDFSEKRLQDAGIVEYYINVNLEKCVDDILSRLFGGIEE